MKEHDLKGRMALAKRMANLHRRPIAIYEVTDEQGTYLMHAPKEYAPDNAEILFTVLPDGESN